MEFVEHTDDRPEPISIARCRELLGEEADSMSDQEVALIRRHAETMAWIVVEIYQEGCRISELEVVTRKRNLPDQSNGSRSLSVLQRRFKTNSTGRTRRSSSNARSTSKRTTGTPRNCARSSPSRGSTVTQGNSMNST